VSVESKIKFRIYALLGAAFIALAFIVGPLYAFLIALLAFLLWKAYTYSKSMRWWKSESVTSRQIIEFIIGSLNEGSNSKNCWVQSLALPEVSEFAKEYRVELMATPLIIEKEPKNLVEGWTEWGATRLEDCVLRLSAEELASNVGSEENPIPMLKVMIAKAAFEITVAEHALALFSVPNPREAVSRRLVSKNLETKKSDTDIAWLAKSQATASALGLLAKELGEGTSEAAKAE
jgi:hypothetical protein